MELSELKKIKLREVWNHEASDFTNWLAEEKNLGLLSEEIGIPIALIETEASVGKFNVDILAEEEGSNRKIIIENQLEVTDHDHLGKVITYASGYDAEILIWIVRDVRDEHKQAVNWLNEHTNEKVNIFLIQMEVWQINESLPAPKFNVIVEPNDWSKEMKRQKSNGELSDLKLLQLEFWTKFKEYVQDDNPAIVSRKAMPQHWYDVSFGSSEAHITLTINSQSKQFRTEVYVDTQDLYQRFVSRKDDIEAELGYQLQWAEQPNKKAQKIRYSIDGDIRNTDEWDKYFDWLLKNTLKFHSVFPKYF